MVLAGRDKTVLAEIGPGWSDYLRLLGVFGATSLAVIFVVLIVIWMGYVKRIRWTWFVMFIIVWVWAFPYLILPNLRLLRMWDLADFARWLNPAEWYAKETSIVARSIVEQALIFSLMLIALIVPIKSFFRRENRSQANHT